MKRTGRRTGGLIALLGMMTAAPSVFAADIVRPRVAWEVKVDGQCAYSEVIAGEALILHVRTDNLPYSRVEARRLANGALVWAKEPGGIVGPTVGDTVVVAESRRLVARDVATGKERWQYALVEGGHFAAPPALDGDALYAAEYRPDPLKRNAVGPSGFFCVDAKTGKEQWRTTLPTGTTAAPVADAKFVYVVRAYGVSCVSKETRAVAWSSSSYMATNTAGRPAVPFDGKVIVPVHGLVCLDARDGREVWQVPGGVNDSRPVLRDGTLYAKSYRPAPPPAMAHDTVPMFVAADPATGDVKWRAPLAKEVRGDPLVTDKSVYVVQWDDSLCRLDRATGAVLWTLDLGFRQWAPHPLAHDGRLYLCFQDKIVCLRDDR